MDTTDALVVVIALASTWAMTGVIWVIQLVHYPIFDMIDRGDDGATWVEFGNRHRTTISIVVGPFMLAEGVTGLWLIADPPGGVSRIVPLIAGALMAVAYGTTAFVSVPLHERLTNEFDVDAHRRLVSTNWIRTAAWTARAVLLVGVAVAAATSTS